jgi:hypothetical protein
MKAILNGVQINQICFRAETTEELFLPTLGKIGRVITSKSNPISPNSIQDTKNRQFVNEPKQLSLKLESDQMLKDIIRSS